MVKRPSDISKKIAAGRRHFYCSRACYAAGKTTATARPCSICGTPIVKPPSLTHDRMFCSRECHTLGFNYKGAQSAIRKGYRPDLGHLARSTWEANVCRVLTAMGFPYEYEPRMFDVGGTYYTPDILVDGSFWIEVKGYMRPAAAEKIAAFLSAYPEEVLVIVDRPVYDAMAREWAGRIPTWESTPHR